MAAASRASAITGSSPGAVLRGSSGSATVRGDGTGGAVGDAEAVSGTAPASTLRCRAGRSSSLSFAFESPAEVASSSPAASYGAASVDEWARPRSEPCGAETFAISTGTDAASCSAAVPDRTRVTWTAVSGSSGLVSMVRWSPGFSSESRTGLPSLPRNSVLAIRRKRSTLAPVVCRSSSLSGDLAKGPVSRLHHDLRGRAGTLLLLFAGHMDAGKADRHTHRPGHRAGWILPALRVLAGRVLSRRILPTLGISAPPCGY